ncbi:MAG: tetratricopeptide repeat-containing serine protease family protein [Candidatus Poribacteria bacterium]|nr:tetratricopeptide repeat-containing serine protease family protein [Candidatus Poribacteria bacterium]
MGYPDGGEGTVRKNPVSEKSNDSFLLLGLPLETIGGPVLNSQGKVIAVVGITDILKSKHIGSKSVEELLEKSKSGTVEPLSQWQKRKPIRLVAIGQFAQKKGRHATVRLIRANGKKRIELGDELGSGFFIAPDKIVTNIHCVADATKIQAKLFGTETFYDIEGVTAFDPKKDLVILKVARKGPKHLSLGDVQIGELIAAVGNPLYSENSETIQKTIAESFGKNVEEGKITNGTVHSIRKSDELIRLTAELLPGNSGGPILSSKGKVIGIAVGGLSSGDIGFAIPSSALEELFTNSEPTQFLELAKWQEKPEIRAYAYRFYQAQELISSALRAEEENKKHLYYKKAIEVLDEAIRLYPRDWQSCYLRGDVKTELGQYQEAIDDFDKVIELIPDGAFAYIARGNAKQDFGYYEGAIADYSKAIQFIPDYAAAYNNRGWATYLWAKDREKVEGKNEIVKSLYYAAIEDYKKTRELSPDHRQASNNLKLAEEALTGETQ